MYRATGSLRPLLHSPHYTTQVAHQQDTQKLREHSWQLVASACQLRNTGDYVSVQRLGLPIVVRNFDGTLAAFENVCAHRQCRLVSLPRGRSDELKCPYHGWRYGMDGRTRKLPGASNFPHFERDKYRLSQYAVRRIGQLVFVRLNEGRLRSQQNGSSVRLECSDDLSLDDVDGWESQFADLTDAGRWRLILDEELSYDCDWKIPLEGSLESYHLSEIHGTTLGEDPGEASTEHRFHDWGTKFRTTARDDSFLARMEERVVRSISGSFNPSYEHIHVFPNVMASFTSTLSLVYQIYPTQPQRCAMRVLGFVRRSERMSFVGNGLSRGLGVFARGFARKVLREDARIFPEVQIGMTGAEQNRIFGRCEERLHAFHEYWLATYNEEAN